MSKPYRLSPDRPPGEEVRRIAVAQLTAILAQIDDEGRDIHERVHEVRKHFKKTRGLVRIVREPLGKTYRFANGWCRDRSRTLSTFRDAEAAIETLDRLSESYVDGVGSDLFERERAALLRIREHITERQDDLVAALAAVREGVSQFREWPLTWPLDELRFSQLARGASRTYSRGRTRFEQAYRTERVGHFHDWRKAVKYHMYHLRILSDLDPAWFKEREGVTHHLSDLLGAEHDLTVLLSIRQAHSREFQEGDHSRVEELCRRMRVRLRSEARSLASPLFRKKRREMKRLLRRKWKSR